MLGTVVTVVGSFLDSKRVDDCLNQLKKLTASEISIDILKNNYAVDFFIPEYSEDLSSKIRKTLSNINGCDVFVQKNDKNRKKKLLIADMDATMISQETLDEVAEEFNLRDQVAFITEKAMNGEMDFEKALTERVKLLEGKPSSALLRVVEKINYTRGAKELILTMNNFGAKSVLVSGGFEIFAKKVSHDLGFHKFFSNRFEIVGKLLTGNVIPPIINKEAKEKILLKEIEIEGINIDETMAIGDGANDIGMLRKAAAGVGYYAKPKVIEEIENHIKHTDLTSLLYMQGYKYSEFVFRAD